MLETPLNEAPAGDLDLFAFSAAGPWVVDPAALEWRRDVGLLRTASRARVPELTRRRVFPPFGRFAQAAIALLGALGGWVLTERRRGDEISRSGLSRRLRRTFERLGPAYIKLGQIVSSGRGIFPDELVLEFQKLRDQVPPESFAVVRRVVETELGRPLEEVFSSFNETCLAAASIAQVHAAVLCSGESVVVKVQRPSVGATVERDVAAMAWIAPWLVGRLPYAALANPPALVELFAETIVEELDFRLEAENMLDIARVVREAGHATVIVPRPHPRLVTRRMLVMERLEGFKVEQVDEMRAAGIQPYDVLRALLITFIEGAVIYGVFHGDLHGGNLFITRDSRVALLDFGMTGRMDERQRRAFLRLMMTGMVNDVRSQLEAFRDLGALDEDADLDAVMKLLRIDEPVRDPTKMQGDELIREIQTVLRGLLAQGARVPKHLLFYLKNILFFDGAISQLAPDLDIISEVVRVYGYFATIHAERIARDIGFDPTAAEVDLSGMRRQLGLEGEVNSLSHRELSERRRALDEKLKKATGRS